MFRELRSLSMCYVLSVSVSVSASLPLSFSLSLLRKPAA